MSEQRVFEAIRCSETDSASVKLTALEMVTQAAATIADPAWRKSQEADDVTLLDLKHPADGPMKLHPDVRAEMLQQAKKARLTDGRVRHKAATDALRHVEAAIEGHVQQASTLPTESEAVRARHAANALYDRDDIRAQQQNNIELLLSRQCEASFHQEAVAYITSATGADIAARYSRATPETDRAFMRVVEAFGPELRAAMARGSSDPLATGRQRDALHAAVQGKRQERLSPSDRTLSERLVKARRQLAEAGLVFATKDQADAAAARFLATTALR